jgi:Zn ribbon nucleic-acid-binding protein
MKLPSYVVQSILNKIGICAAKVNTSSVFVYKAKCPICNDYKTRLYIREYQTFFNVKCHNCGYSTSFESFIKDNYPQEYDELRASILDSIRTGDVFKKRKSISNKKTINLEELDSKLRQYIKDNSFNIMESQTGKLEILRHKATEYLNNRKIPTEIYKDFSVFLHGPLRGYIGIPFFDQSKKFIIHIQGRLFAMLGRENPAKYLFLSDKKNDIQMESKELWGQWRTTANTETVICEGTLDACAFRNGIATCGATLGESYIMDLCSKYKHRIWCVDSYFSDVAGRKLIKSLLKMGEKCFIIPKKLGNIKDANQLLINSFKNHDYIPMEYVRENIYDGKFSLAKLEIKEKLSII